MLKFIMVFISLMSLSFTTFAKDSENSFTINTVAVGDVPNAIMEDIKFTLNKELPELLPRYGIETMPPVTVKIWQDRQAFEAAFGDNAQYVQGYVIQEDWEVRFFNGMPNLGYGVLHEYMHLVSLHINPKFNNNPRWLWEAIAIYESGRPPVPKLNTLKCFSQDTVPTIASLNEHPFNIYKLGHYLTEFIVNTWGKASLIKLIQNEGDIKATLNVSTKQFESQWIHYLKEKDALAFSEQSSEDC